jgi:hypothetical protein
MVFSKVDFDLTTGIEKLVNGTNTKLTVQTSVRRNSSRIEISLQNDRFLITDYDAVGDVKKVELEEFRFSAIVGLIRTYLDTPDTTIYCIRIE